MAKVKYKKITENLDAIVAPEIQQKKPRDSLYSTTANVLEHYALDISVLIPFKNQARKHFKNEDIQELSESIKSHGIRQPLTVIRSQEIPDKYEVVSGERRLRAAVMASLRKVPCIIISDYSEAEEIALIENIQREDLHPIEIGEAFLRLLNSNQELSQSSLAQKLGVTKQYVSDRISYCKLPNHIKEHAIKNNLFSRDALRQLLKEVPSEDINQNPVLTTKKTLKRTASVLRVSMKDDVYKYQVNGLRKLSLSDLYSIRETMLDVLDKEIEKKSAAAD